MEDSLLKVKEVTKYFGGLQALDKVDLCIERGLITGLIGPNGAGKTTLFNIIAGFYPPSGGNVFLDGECLNGLPVHKRVERGIARTFQITRMFKQMNVLENVMVGAHSWTTRNRAMAFLAGMLNLSSIRHQEAEILEYAVEMLRLAGIEKLAHEMAGTLPHGQQRLLEMARAMTTKPKLLLLDEPAAGLNPHEVDVLRKALRSIVTNTETTILLVEHDMRMVMETCDWVYVFDFGRKIAEDIPEGITKNKKVVEAYLGKEYSHASA